MITMDQLRDAVEERLEMLEAQAPPNFFFSRRELRLWTANKWACKELLRDIEEADSVPFVITPLEILEGFKRKMDDSACSAKNERREGVYLEASDLVTWIMEDLAL